MSSLAKPPISPLSSDSQNESTYFDILVQLARQYVEKDGIQLDFSGYKETLMEYANLKEQDKKRAWVLARDLNAWAEYFSSLANLIQKLYLDAETDKISAQAIASYEADPRKVANGDRLSNKNPQVIEARKKRNILKALYDELEAKVKFLERAHYHCKITYELASRYQTSYQSDVHSQVV